jgi:hypothetical protein
MLQVGATGIRGGRGEEASKYRINPNIRFLIIFLKKERSFAHRAAQTQNKRTQTSMPRVGFETTIQVFERAKKVHALDLAATVIGTLYIYRS